MRFGKKIFRSRQETEIDVSECDGVRTLHLGSTAIQSAMRIAKPDHLELAYTRAMMAFLLFKPEPSEILMVGLGGGSLAKFVHQYMDGAKTVVVEISPKVVTVARHLFHLPEDDERLSVIIEDGAAYLPGRKSIADIVMIDAYDGHAQPELLTTRLFYAHAREALKEEGILVVNLWGSDKHFSTYLSRIEEAFDNLVLCLPTEKRGNIIVFGFKSYIGNFDWQMLKAAAKILSSRYGLEFADFVEGLKKMNRHTEKKLLLSQ